MLVEFGGRAVRAVPLSWYQNAICLCLGAFSLIWGVIIKIILPPSLFSRLAINDKAMSKDEEENSTVATFRRSYR